MNFIGGPFDGLRISLEWCEWFTKLDGRQAFRICEHGVKEITLRQGDKLHRYEYREDAVLIRLPPGKYLNADDVTTEDGFVYVSDSAAPPSRPQPQNGN